MAGLRVLLIGLMAAGKSTIGRPLALRLGCPYVDNDELVRRATGSALEELKERVGGEGLHDAEVAALREALATEPPVVASVAAYAAAADEGRKLLHPDPVTVVVWLRATPETLAARVGEGGDRPWLKPDPLSVFRKMTEDRYGHYAEVADVTVDVDELTPTQVADRLAAQLAERAQANEAKESEAQANEAEGSKVKESEAVGNEGQSEPANRASAETAGP